MGSTLGCQRWHYAIRAARGPPPHTRLSKPCSRLPVFAEFEIGGVKIVLAETTTKGTTTGRNGVEVWTRPAMAYASTVRLFESSHSRQGGEVFYILPHPDANPGLALGSGTAGRDVQLYREGKDHLRTPDILDATKQTRIGNLMTVWTGERKLRGKYEGAPKWKLFIPSLPFPATRDECRAAWLNIKP